MILVVGLPAPWPALVSMRIRTGFSPDWAAWRRGGELEAVGGDDAVVVVGGGDQGGRVAGAGLEVVERRVGVEGLELVRVVGGAVVVGPGPADGELVEAEHVHDADGGQGGAEEVGALGHAGADEQAAVAAAADGELGALVYLFGDQPLGGGDEVVEDVLLVQLGAGLVPVLAVLAAAAEVGARRRRRPFPSRRGWRRQKPGVRLMLKPP